MDFGQGIFYRGHGLTQKIKGRFTPFEIPVFRVSEYNQRLRLWNLCIAWSHAMHKRCSAPFKSDLPISFVSVTKETGERKRRRSIAARLFFASIFAPPSADCESSAYNVFGFAEWFRCLCSHAFFAEA